MKAWRVMMILALFGVLGATSGCLFFARPEAVIDLSPSAGVVPLTISFAGGESSGAGGIDTYRWTFGTGEESFESSGTYTYDHAGRYTLSLTVRDAAGETATASVEIVVEPAFWICDENLARIYKLDPNGAVLKEIASPISEPRGIAVAEVAGQKWLYVACYGGGNQRLLRIDPTSGAVSDESTAPAQDPLYLAFGAKEPRRLWHLDGLSRRIYGLNPETAQVHDSFGTNYFRATQQVGNEVFLQSPQGLGWEAGTEGAGRLWYLEGETGLLYAIEIDPPIDIFEGVQLEIDRVPIPVDVSVFPVAGLDAYDGYLWLVARDAHALVQIDPATGLPTGEQIAGFPGANTSGLAIEQ